MSTHRGLFIVFEGLDRSGKTTQSKLAAKMLCEQYTVANMQERRFPDYDSAVGQVIRSYLRSEIKMPDRTAYLLFCGNRWEHVDTINSVVEGGGVVVCDRYTASGVAYGVAKGAPLEWCREVESGLLKPDIVVYLDAPPSVVAQRANFGVGDRHENLELQEKIHAVYETLKEENWVCVSAVGTVEEVAVAVKKALLERIEEKFSDRVLRVKE